LLLYEGALDGRLLLYDGVVERGIRPALDPAHGGRFGFVFRAIWLEPVAAPLGRFASVMCVPLLGRFTDGLLGRFVGMLLLG
jgi:hypothetical protein